MATTLVGYKTASTDNTASTSIDLPTGTLSGDILIAFAAKDGTSSPSMAGFNTQYNAAATGGSSRDAVFWKLAQAEPSSYIYNNGGNERTWLVLAAFREVDPVNPFDDFQVLSNDGNDATQTIPEINRSAIEQMCVAFLGLESGNSGNPINPTWSSGGWTTISNNQNGPPGTGSGSAAGAFAIQQTNNVGALPSTDFSYVGGNSTGQTIVFTLNAGAPPEIGITSADIRLLGNDTGLEISGFGFNALQGTGKVELGDNIEYSTATLETQTAVSWSDTQVIYNTTNLSTFNYGFLYLFITNSDGDRSAIELYFGLLPYEVIISNSRPDHWWGLNGDYDDLAGGIPLINQSTATNGFANVGISEGTTESWRVQGGKRETGNSSNMNLTTTTNRLMGGWVRFGGISKVFSCIYEEGGSINNLAFFLGVGNTLIAQLADTGDDNVQAFSDFSLEPNRNYHILFRFSYTDAEKRFDLYIDGIRQNSTSGNPLTSSDLDAHSGDIAFGSAGGNLEVGGTDIRFLAQEDTYYSNWVTYSVSTSQDLIKDLFRRGAVPTYTLTKGTQAEMQTQLNALAGTIASNSPLTLRIDETLDASPLNLDLDNFTFSELSTIHLEYRGTKDLNITNANGSNLTPEKVYATQDGTVNIINQSILTLTGLQPNTEVRIYRAGTEIEVSGSESVTGIFSSFLLLNSVDVSILSLKYENIKLKGVNTSTNISLPIQQVLDRQYKNN
jgi:hypothetical protein